jgi:hypothetical protein
MRTATERDALFLDIVVKNDPDFIPPRTIIQLLENINNLIPTESNVSNRTTKWYRQKTRKVFIRNKVWFNDDKSLACLPIYDTNSAKPEASYTDLDTDVQRDIEKQDREGRPESVHLVLSTNGNPGNTDTYRAIMEGSGSLNRGFVESYLNGVLKIVRQTSPETFRVERLDGARHRDGSPITQRFTPLLELQGHLSREFREDLEAGILRGISLETSKREKLNLGETRFVHERM